MLDLLPWYTGPHAHQLGEASDTATALIQTRARAAARHRRPRDPGTGGVR
jgi:hypothetical protein